MPSGVLHPSLRPGALRSAVHLPATAPRPDTSTFIPSTPLRSVPTNATLLWWILEQTDFSKGIFQKTCHEPLLISLSLVPSFSHSLPLSYSLSPSLPRSPSLFLSLSRFHGQMSYFAFLLFYRSASCHFPEVLLMFLIGGRRDLCVSTFFVVLQMLKVDVSKRGRKKTGRAGSIPLHSGLPRGRNLLQFFFNYRSWKKPALSLF